MTEFLLLEMGNLHHSEVGLGLGYRPLPADPVGGIPASKMLELLGRDENLRDTELLSLKHANLSQAVGFKLKHPNLPALLEEAVESRKQGWIQQEKPPQVTCPGLATKQ